MMHCFPKLNKKIDIKAKVSASKTVLFSHLKLGVMFSQYSVQVKYKG